MKFNISSVFPLLAMIILIVALSRQMFKIPPLGKILDPYTGVVRNAGDQELDGSALALNGLGLSYPVQVFFDKRKVPHIYAGNSRDLYFAQGYVTACLRLWQMDFLSYVSAGRLSEIFDESFLDYDRNQRRMGILESARTSLQLIQQDTVTAAILAAYTRGVNAYISTPYYDHMPLEYKLMDYKPEPWTDLKTVLIMKYMANLLSGYEEDVSQSNLILALGEKRFNRLFPDFPSHITPVVNEHSPSRGSRTDYIKKPPYLDYSFLSSRSLVPENAYNPKLGSNSWAVSGQKTKSGFPILCNDPHLNLSLPAIWLELQLSSPEENVYGVSIPGTPAVIIGFNKDIAWGITNGADDVKDWYKLKITNDYKQYELDGKWIDVGYWIEEIKIRNKPCFRDTIYRTVQGPVVNDTRYPGQHPDRKDFALKWELHRPSNEFRTFIALNKAVNYREYRDAISHYSCPIQNFTFICKDNTISIDHQGKMALKPPGAGKFILDGTQSQENYQQYIPGDSLPHMVDPACHFVVSANQHPTFAGYKYYYNGYYSENRANRIQQVLEGTDSFTLDKMEALQLDNTNYFAVSALPVLLKRINAAQLTGTQQRYLKELAGWKGTYNAEDDMCRLFDLWWNNTKNYTWDEFKQFTFSSKMPGDDVLLDLIGNNPDDSCFDRQGTTRKEDAFDIVTAAFAAAAVDYDQLKSKGSVAWADLNRINIAHLSNIDALGRTNIPSAGCPEAIDAISKNWGPSWRMVVELGDRPSAFGVYAGGQSGNPGSIHYDDFINDWNKGKYYRLDFYMSVEEAKRHAVNSWSLN